MIHSHHSHLQNSLHSLVKEFNDFYLLNGRLFKKKSDEKQSVAEVICHAETLSEHQDQYNPEGCHEPLEKACQLEEISDFLSRFNIDKNKILPVWYISSGSLAVRFSVTDPLYATTLTNIIRHSMEHLTKVLPQDILQALGFKRAPDLSDPISQIQAFHVHPLSLAIKRKKDVPDLDCSFDIAIWRGSQTSISSGIRLAIAIHKRISFTQQKLWNSRRYFHFLFNQPELHENQPLRLQSIPPKKNEISLRKKWAASALLQLDQKGFRKIMPVRVDEDFNLYFEASSYCYYFLITWNPDFFAMCKHEIESQIPDFTLIFQQKSLPIQAHLPSLVHTD